MMNYENREAQEEWAKALLSARKHANDDKEAFNHFINLAEKASSGGLFEAKALIATISDNPADNGEGEAVLSLLSEYPSTIRIKAILEELPRFREDVESEWAESVIETEARFHSDELIMCGKEANNDIKTILIEILQQISAETIQRGEFDFADPLLQILK